MAERADVRIHPTAEVSPEAVIGPGTSIWNQAQVRERARIGAGCIIGKNAYVDFDVVLGDRVKVQNNVSLFHGVTVEDGVFVGPHVCFTNDRVPRAIVRRGSMASFLARALALPPATRDYFVDDAGLIHEANINRVAEAGLTTGCGASAFCPDEAVNRQQVAAFLYRALGD